MKRATAATTVFLSSVLALLVSACSSTPPSKSTSATTLPPAKGQAEVVLLHLSDLHGQLRGHSQNGGGYARVAAFIKSEKRAAEGAGRDVLAIVGGDSAGKSALPCRNSDEKACFSLLKSLGFDVGMVGNGELKRSVTQLNELVSAAGIPFVGANIRAVKGSPLWQKQYLWTAPKSGAQFWISGWTRAPSPGEVDLKKAGLEVALSPSSAQWTQWAAHFQGKPVIWAPHQDMPEDEALLADICRHQTQIRSVVYLKSDTHQIRDLRTHCIPLFEAGAFGQGISKVLLRKTGSAAGDWTMVSHEYVPLGVDAPMDSAVKGEIDDIYKRLAPDADQVVATVPAPKDEVAVSLWLAETYKSVSRADVAIVNSGAVKRSIEPGTLTKEELLLTLPYNNDLMGLDWSYSDFEKSLCAAAARERNPLEDFGSELAIAGATLINAGQPGCRLEGQRRGSVKVVVDDYLVRRSKRWLGRDLAPVAFKFGVTTEQAINVRLKKSGGKIQ